MDRSRFTPASAAWAVGIGISLVAGLLPLLSGSLPRERDVDALLRAWEGYYVPASSAYKQRQIELIRSPRIATMVLRRTDIAELPWLKSQPDPVAWLSNALEVETKQNSPEIRVTLRGDATTEQLAMILNALLRVYEREATDVERKEIATKLTGVDQSLSQQSKELDAAIKKLESHDQLENELLDLEVDRLKESTLALRAQRRMLESQLRKLPLVEVVRTAYRSFQ